MVSILDHEIANRLTFDTSSCPCGGTYQGQPPPQALCFSQGRAERLVMSRKGPWEGYRRQAKRRLARRLLPAFLCVHMFIERETSGCEAASRMFNRKFEECDIHRNLPKIQYFLDLISALGYLWLFL